jgi:predicted DNA binding CopG/RHH family protein
METNATRRLISIRVPEDQLAQIRERAAAAGLTLTEYLLRAALTAEPVEKRLDRVDRRLARIERRLTER